MSSERFFRVRRGDSPYHLEIPQPIGTGFAANSLDGLMARARNIQAKAIGVLAEFHTSRQAILASNDLTEQGRAKVLVKLRLDTTAALDALGHGEIVQAIRKTIADTRLAIAEPKNDAFKGQDAMRLVFDEIRAQRVDSRRDKLAALGKTEQHDAFLTAIQTGDAVTFQAAQLLGTLADKTIQDGRAQWALKQSPAQAAALAQWEELDQKFAGTIADATETITSETPDPRSIPADAAKVPDFRARIEKIAAEKQAAQDQQGQ